MTNRMKINHPNQKEIITMRKFSFMSLAFVLGLTACSGSTAAPESTTTTTEMVTTTTEYVLTDADKDLIFITELTSAYPAFVQQFGKPKLIELARALCGDIDTGLTFDQLSRNIHNAGLDNFAGELGYTFGVAIPVYCPENQWFIDSLG